MAGQQRGRTAPVEDGKPKRRAIDWSRDRREAFLDQLAGNCNVTAAARAIGVDPTTIHCLRRRDRAFAAAWLDAVEAGAILIETRLVGHALAGLTPADAVERAGTDGEPIDFEVAVRVLTMREALNARRARGEQVSGVRPRRALAKETDDAILRKLRALAPSILAEADRTPADDAA